MQRSFHYPSEEILQQIQHRIEKNNQHSLEIPSQEDCLNLRDAALNGDEIAIERVHNLFHFAVVPTSVQQRVSLSIIFEVYNKVSKH
jgi:hypothetical protein